MLSVWLLDCVQNAESSRIDQVSKPVFLVLRSKRSWIEKKYLRKVAEKKPERRESEKPNTICIDCKHAVPTADGKFGCEWSQHFQPVTGWVAVRRDLKVQGGAGKVHLSLSYKVESCPKFIEG